jgi:hypothetical protein
MRRRSRQESLSANVLSQAPSIDGFQEIKEIERRNSANSGKN